MSPTPAPEAQPTTAPPTGHRGLDEDWIATITGLVLLLLVLVGVIPTGLVP